ALGYTGLISTHILSCEMGGLFTILACLLFAKSVFQKKRFLELLKTVTLTILLNLWFLLPFLDCYIHEKYYVNDGSRNGLSIQMNGLYFRRLFANLFVGVDDKVPSSPGFAFGLILVAGFLFFLSAKSETLFKFSIKGGFRVFLLACLATWMSTDLFPYDFLKRFPGYNTLSSIQFPYRYLGVSMALLTFVLCGFLKELKINANLTLAYLASSLFFIAISVFQGVSFQVYEDVHIEDLTRYFCDTIGIPSFNQINGEYIPSGTDTAYLNRMYAYNLDGNVYVLDYEIGKGYVQVTASASDDGIVNVPLLYYKGYEARDLETGEQLTVSKDWNMVAQVEVPAGYDGTFDVRFRGLPYWRIGHVVSLVTLAAGLGFVLGRRKK
ncbi:MAG: hypothetical protein IJU50_05650, partial [Lachnospiraceae bacterium]|nr:hypothetical protein [Lachnospiraceae bacterium]